MAIEPILRKLKKDKVELMSKSTSENISPKRKFVTGAFMATALAVVAKPISMLASGRTKNLRGMSQNTKLSVTPNSQAVARRKK